MINLHARSNRNTRAADLGVTPIASRNCSLKCCRLQPISSASRWTGTEPWVFSSLRQAQVISLWVGWAKLRKKRPIQDREALAPRAGREKHLDEISGTVSPDIG